MTFGGSESTPLAFPDEAYDNVLNNITYHKDKGVNNNRAQLIDFCLEHQLMIVNTTFNKPEEKLATIKITPQSRWNTKDTPGAFEPSPGKHIRGYEHGNSKDV